MKVPPDHRISPLPAWSRWNAKKNDLVLLGPPVHLLFRQRTDRSLSARYGVLDGLRAAPRTHGDSLTATCRSVTAEMVHRISGTVTVGAKIRDRKPPFSRRWALQSAKTGGALCAPSADGPSPQPERLGVMLLGATAGWKSRQVGLSVMNRRSTGRRRNWCPGLWNGRLSIVSVGDGPVSPISRCQPTGIPRSEKRGEPSIKGFPTGSLEVGRGERI